MTERTYGPCNRSLQEVVKLALEGIPVPISVQELAKHISELEIDNEKLRSDAERYRYLRDINTDALVFIPENGEICVELGCNLWGAPLDKAIDAARLDLTK